MRLGLCFLASALIVGCGGGGKQKKVRAAPDAFDGPAWAYTVHVSADKLCGLGVAGASFSEESPYPKQISRERAVRNLAGILGTQVQEAIIDQATLTRQTVQFARVLHVDEELIAHVDQLAETEYWLDKAGQGPFNQGGFMYALACIDVNKASVALKLDRAMLRSEHASSVDPSAVPAWIASTGKQAGGRLCAVGYSLPAFHPEKTFERVVEDVRGQLAEVIETLVSSYYEELTTGRGQAAEMMTVATTQAVAKGVMVTHFWYDPDGIGPNRQTRSTYGWGCVYPMDVMRASFQAVEEKAPPEEKDKIARVRERAEAAFDALDAEIDKRAPDSGTAGAPPAHP